MKNLIEGWGAGIPGLYREMKEYGLSGPEFVDMEKYEHRSI